MSADLKQGANHEYQGRQSDPEQARLPSWKRAMKPRSRRYAKPSATISTIIRSPIPKPARKAFLSIRSCRSPGTAPIIKPSKRAPGDVSPMPVAIPPPLRIRKLFRNYLLEQLTLLYQDYGAHISVELSQHEILSLRDRWFHPDTDRSMSAGLTRYFPTTELSQIGDETADGLFHPTEFYPLSHFDARRVDFRWRVCVTTPARRRNTSSPTCCSPTIPATWMSSSAGAAARSSIPTAPISLSPAPAGSDHRRDRSAGTGHFRSGVEEAPDAGLASDHPRRQRDHPD